jgi:hypothetical protein
MLNFRSLLIAAAMLVAGATASVAGPFSPALQANPSVDSPMVVLAQYGRRSLCENWNRACTRLHGFGTHNWNACMSQPGAIQDCGGSYRGGPPGGGYTREYRRFEGRPQAQPYGRASCRTWQRNCARLHGFQTGNWYQCMNQPGARRDCDGF